MNGAAVRAILALAASLALHGAETRTIPNVLGQDWPWELVSMDFTPGAVKADWVATIEGVDGPRPIQLEAVQVDGKPMERVWFIATVGAKQVKADVTFAPGSAAATLALRNEAGFTIVDNGVAELRLNLASPAAGTPFERTPHWLGGLRVKGEKAWDARAVFSGTSAVATVAAQQVAAGPVFAEWRLTYEFADAKADGTVEAVPLMLGKHSFRFAPNRIPREVIPKQERRYEVGVRITAGDPWIEVVERYRLPRDPAVKDWGIHQTMLTIGTPAKDDAPVPGFTAGDSQTHDTVLWMRWFEYDAFGGNTRQLADPAQPRPAQKGRPFAQMRARWSQGPAGTQDVIMTSGGDTALTVADMRRRVEDRLNHVRKEAEKPADKRGKGKEFVPAIAQAAALLAGAPGEDDAARTALAEASKLLGIGMPAGIGYRPDAPAIGLIAAYPSKWVGPYAGTIMMQAWDRSRGVFRIPLLDGDKDLASNQPIHYGGRCYALVAGRRDRFDSTGKIESLIRRHSDWTLTAQVNRYQLDRAAQGKPKGAPNPAMYLNKRYQCDDVNPTNYGNRRMVNDGFAKNLDQGAAFGPNQVAAGYIYCDLDAWPGWHSGWGPGNPNFHTDKYMAAIYAAVTMRDHPHAKDWLAFGRSCLDEDLSKVFLPPDGVGSECPGYSGYSLGLQAEVSKAIFAAGLGNPLFENPLVAKSITWHRKLLTPFDRRLGLRHEAPIGDTHRWTSGLAFDHLLPFYEQAAPAVAEELRLAHRLTKDKQPGGSGAEKLDWSSQAFKGFGAILRHAFGTPQESFLALKSGSTGGHYHNDDQTFHWYHRGTPVVLDYNCSYHPRGDHAGLHNGITLGIEGKVPNNARNTEVAAMEQPFGPADVVRTAFAANADVVVADRRIHALSLSPLDPHDGEFNRDYPSRKVDAHHRRLLLLAKHAKPEPFSDYLVLRDEIRTDLPQQVNLHVLARSARIDGDRVWLSGQWDQDILVQVVEATEAKLEIRHWAYIDEWMAPPEDYLPKPGETVEAWDARLPKERPASGWKPTYIKREEIAANEKRWHEALQATDGLALSPPPGWNSTWTFGEVQRWVRIASKPGTPVTVVIYPYAKGAKPPVITRDGDAIVIEADGKRERVVLSSAAGASLDGTAVMPPVGAALVGENTPQLPR